MATHSVLTFDAEGRAVDFEVWVDDLQLFLQCDRADGLSLFNLTSGASPAPPATAHSTVRSQHCSLTVGHTRCCCLSCFARYSSAATAALSRLILPYLFPDLAAFPTVADLITHLRTSDTRYRAALPAEDHFLSVCPTTLTVDLLEQRLLAAETSIVAIGASRGDPRTPVFEGRSELCLPLAGDAAPAGARGARALVGLAGAVEVVVVAVEGVGVVVGVVAGVEVSAAVVEAEEAVAVVEGAEAAEVAEAAGVAEAAEAAVELVAALRRGVAPVAVRASSSSSSRPVAVSLADPSGGPVLASFSTVLPCPAAPSGTLSGLYLPSFSTNLVSGADLQDQGVDQFTPASQRVTHCTCARTGRHLATFTRRPGSSLYTLSTESPPVPASGQVAASSQVIAKASGSGPESAPCSCRLLSHQTLLWHHRLGHPSLPRLRGMASRVLGPYSSQWQSAMDAEMASWKSTGTYVDEVPPPGANIVSGMWIFRVKRPPGSPPVFKARYVARGFSQRQGVDYFQTFSPTPKMTTLRVLLHVAAQRDYELHSLDFSTAFLQGSLHEEIWLRRPSGFTGSFPPGTQWSLRRPVYGLCQAPREWHDTLRTTLAALGFAPSTADPSLFLRTDTALPPFYILVYVDDLVFATADTAGVAHVKSELQKRHTCTDLGELRIYLGLQITRDRAQRTITLTQSHMVQQVLQRFDFTYSSPQATPLSTRHSLSALPSDESVEQSGPYPELVGCLMYLMTCTRPDLAYPLSILARYVAPGRHRPEHMAAAKRVLRYLWSTSGMGLVLGGRHQVVLTGHADASWADDQATQRSSQGYSFSLGSGSVSWRSTRSSSVLSSSCEAEIYAGAMAAQKLRWLSYLLTDLGEPPRSPPVLYVDNKAMLALCREHRLEHRTKHIALRYFLARELQQRGQLRLAYVASEANTADIFTKALPPGDHQRFCTLLGLLALLCFA
ncbi:unnamed protein product [Closterium sp. NIES-53]